MDLYILIAHILTSIFIAYIAISIICKKLPPVFIGYFLILLVGAMIGFHIYMYSSTEKFCTCRGAQMRNTYVDRQLVDELYRTGVLTEYTDLAALQGNLYYMKQDAPPS